MKIKEDENRVFPVIHIPTMTTPSSFKIILFVLLCGQCSFGWTQRELEDCQWTEFFHDNGAVASEGCLIGGVPTGIWTNYDQEGTIESQGARKNNVPDGVWLFYVGGVLREKCMFEEGVKHGAQILWENGIKTDSIPWNNGSREGMALSFRKNGSVAIQTPYKANKKEGKATGFNTNNERIFYRWYKENRLVASESFNRYDAEGKKTGPWKVFHPTGREIETGFYENGLKHGVFQSFDARGKLQRVVTYRFGKIVEDDVETQPKAEVQTTKREDGSIAESITYLNGVRHGVARQFDENGDVISGAVFEEDVLIAEGVTRENGKRHGPWMEYWPNGELKAKGEYVDGNRDGFWVFYRDTGEKEQEGTYLEGNIHGTWTWWHPGGKIHREESYNKGQPEGEFLELDTAGKALVSGEYIGGEREGFWRVHINDHMEEGSYLSGQKHGIWTHTYGSGLRQFEGEFDFGQPIGKHRFWHPNGVIEEEGKYEGGVKHKKWKLFNEEGSVVHEYIYKYGKLRKVDGSRVDKRRDGKLKGN